MKKIKILFLCILILEIGCKESKFPKKPLSKKTKYFAQLLSKQNFSNTKNKPENKINNIISNQDRGQDILKAKEKTQKIIKATLLKFGSTDRPRGSSFNTSNNQTVVIGNTNANGNSQDFVLARYNSSGQLDTSFGTKGVTVTDFLTILGAQFQLSGSIDIPRAHAVLSNGSIIVAGTSNALNPINQNSLSTGNFALAKYTNVGKLDTSFGTQGVTVIDLGSQLAGIPGSNDKAIGINVQSNGNILVAGYTTISNIFLNSSFVIASFKSNGQIDTSFGLGGANFVNFALTLNPNATTASIDVATSFHVQSNGSIIICGYSNAQNPNFDFAIARFTSNGQLDNSFGTGGVTLTNISQVIGTSSNT